MDHDLVTGNSAGDRTGHEYDVCEDILNILFQYRCRVQEEFNCEVSKILAGVLFFEKKLGMDFVLNLCRCSDRTGSLSSSKVLEEHFGVSISGRSRGLATTFLVKTSLKSSEWDETRRISWLKGQLPGFTTKMSQRKTGLQV